MKKRSFSMIALLIAVILVVFTACETEVAKTDGESTTAGTTVVVTETTEPVTDPISMDRVNDAMVQNNVNAYADGSTEVTVPGTGAVVGGDSGADSGSTVVEVQDDEAVIRSGVYHIVGKADLGSGITPMEVAVKDDQIYMNIDTEQGSMAIIITSEHSYIILHDYRMYLELDREFMESEGINVDDLLTDIQFSGEEEAAAVEYQETVNGIIYDVREYESGRKMYLIGKTMIMGKSQDGSVIYYDDICAEVDDSIFSVPAGYTTYE